MEQDQQSCRNRLSETSRGSRAPRTKKGLATPMANEKVVVEEIKVSEDEKRRLAIIAAVAAARVSSKVAAEAEGKTKKIRKNPGSFKITSNTKA